MKIKYIAPNKKYFAIDTIMFDKQGKKLTAELISTSTGLILRCNSRKFVRRASNMAGQYHKVTA